MYIVLAGPYMWLGAWFYPYLSRQSPMGWPCRWGNLRQTPEMAFILQLFTKVVKMRICPRTQVYPHIWGFAENTLTYDKLSFPQLKSVFHSLRPFIHNIMVNSAAKRRWLFIQCFCIWVPQRAQAYIWGLAVLESGTAVFLQSNVCQIGRTVAHFPWYRLFLPGFARTAILDKLSMY